MHATTTKAQDSAAAPRRKPRPPSGHARPLKLAATRQDRKARRDLANVLIALDAEPCECKGVAGDETCLRWHVLPFAHRLHPDDWHRLLEAWSADDYGEGGTPEPVEFLVPATPTATTADDAARQARLAVYEERARRRQRLDCPGDMQRVVGRAEAGAEAEDAEALLAWFRGRALLEGVA